MSDSTPTQASVSTSTETTSTDETTQNPNTELVQSEQQTPATLKKKFKIKVDGQELEEELDLNDEDTIRRHLQMSKAAQKRMQEAAKERQKAERFIRQLKEDPISVLTNPDLGVNFRDIAEQYLAQQLEAEIMSPEQRKVMEAERIIREKEEQTRKTREAEEQAQLEQLQEHYAQDYQKKITQALSESGLPKTRNTVKKMAYFLHQNVKFGLDLTPKDLAAMVKEDYIRDIQDLFGSTDGDTLLGILGDDISNKIRKSDLNRIKTKVAPVNSNQAISGQHKEEKKKFVNRDEWRAYLDKKVSE